MTKTGSLDYCTFKEVERSILFLVYLCLVSSQATNKSVVQFSLMVSSAETLNTSGIVPAVDKVLEVINNDTAILPGHRLEYSMVLEHQVSECTPMVLSLD